MQDGKNAILPAVAVHMPPGVTENQQQGQKPAVHIVRDIAGAFGQLPTRTRRSLRPGAAMTVHTARAMGATGAFRAVGAVGAAITPEGAIVVVCRAAYASDT